MITLGFWHTKASLNLSQSSRSHNNQQKKKTCKIADFVVPTDHRVKLKKREKKDEYFDHARELKKLWNMKLMFIPTVICALGTDTKGLIKGQENLQIRGRVDTIQNTREESWRLEETCCHSNSSERPSARADG